MCTFQSKPEKFNYSQNNQLFFTSDMHAFHKRIVEFTGRPTLIENHNEWLIKQCNSVIPVATSELKVTTIHHGDFLFSCTNEEAERFLSRLNGDWWFVLGNHDNPEKLITVINTVNKTKGTNHRILGWYYRLLVTSPSLEPNGKSSKKMVVMCHFPIHEWDSMDRGSYHTFGHLHGGGSQHSGFPLPNMPNRMDVGIDGDTNNKPISWLQLRKKMTKSRELYGNAF